MNERKKARKKERKNSKESNSGITQACRLKPGGLKIGLQ